MNFEMPFSIPEFASGAELFKFRKNHGVSLEDLARVMGAARSYVMAIEERPCLRSCTVRRYLLALYCFVSARKATAAQKSKKNSSDAEQPNGFTKARHGA
jgi:transcriptional regulator with XRE-family HTH domain